LNPPANPANIAYTCVNRPFAGPYTSRGASVVSRIVPDPFVRGELGKARVEDVDGIGKELGKAANKRRREIRVKKKLQRDIRSRPACEA
jgi:hypothetical protein